MLLLCADNETSGGNKWMNSGGISSSKSMSRMLLHYQCDRTVLNLDSIK